MSDKVFKKALSVKGVHGRLNTTLVFETKEQMNKEIHSLIFKYGSLRVTKKDLPGLRVGDKCNVWGDGDEVYTITGIKKLGENRWGFILDSGVLEDVAKCHTENL